MKELLKVIQDWNSDETFFGVISITTPNKIEFQQSYGYRNKVEKLPNQLDTSFAIASGTKFFTALAICQLIDRKYLKLEDRIEDLITHDLKLINKEITVFQLLTHTSDLECYVTLEESIAEKIADGYNINRLLIEKLYGNHPVHKWDSLEYYLPMFNELPPRCKSGEQFNYSNAGLFY